MAFTAAITTTTITESYEVCSCRLPPEALEQAELPSEG